MLEQVATPRQAAGVVADCMTDDLNKGLLKNLYFLIIAQLGFKIQALKVRIEDFLYRLTPKIIERACIIRLSHL